MGGSEVVDAGARCAGRRHRRNVRRPLGRVVGVAVCCLLLVLLAACGTPAPTGPNPAAVHGPPYRISAAQVGGLGRVLVDGNGFTLYLFVPDGHSSRSTCTGVCAVAWPPLLLPTGVTEPIAGSGVKPSLLGTTKRSEGTVQITYHGWPLYRWSNDSGPGQATGQGLNNLGGLWFVVDPAGNPVR